MKLLWTIKEDSRVNNFSSENKIHLSQTSYMSKKRRECSFLHGTHNQLSKWDNVKKAMDVYLGKDKVNYGLYQGRRTVSRDE